MAARKAARSTRTLLKHPVTIAEPSTVEFVVVGVPVSVNTKNRKNRQASITIVKEAARARISESERLEYADVRTTMVWFHTDAGVADTDNIAKCILDGAQSVAFGDDRQNAQVLVRRTRTAGVVLRSPPAMVADATRSTSHRNGLFANHIWSPVTSP